jgi:acyl-CoA thioester hydrolase
MMGRMPARRVLVPLRWSDMDAYGHVNNVQFLRLLEDARVVLFAGPRFRGEPKPDDTWTACASTSAREAAERSADDNPATPDHVVLLDGGLIVARAEIEYLRPLEYRVAPVAIDVWVSAVRGAEFVLGYRVTDPTPEQSPSPLPDGAGDLDGHGPYAIAETTMVPYDLEARRPRRLRPEERDVLRAWGDEPVAFRRRPRDRHP